MVCCRNGDDVARQLIDLHEQERHDALYLAGLVDVPSLLSDGVEFVEKQHAWNGPRVVEKAREARVRLTEV